MSHRYDLPRRPTPRGIRSRPSTEGTVLIVLLVGTILSILLGLALSAA